MAASRYFQTEYNGSNGANQKSNRGGLEKVIDKIRKKAESATVQPAGRFFSLPPVSEPGEIESLTQPEVCDAGIDPGASASAEIGAQPFQLPPMPCDSDNNPDYTIITPIKHMLGEALHYAKEVLVKDPNDPFYGLSRKATYKMLGEPKNTFEQFVEESVAILGYTAIDASMGRMGLKKKQ